jgi:hypothetical protein
MSVNIESTDVKKKKKRKLLVYLGFSSLVLAAAIVVPTVLLTKKTTDSKSIKTTINKLTINDEIANLFKTNYSINHDQIVETTSRIYDSVLEFEDDKITPVQLINRISLILRGRPLINESTFKSVVKISFTSATLPDVMKTFEEITSEKIELNSGVRLFDAVNSISVPRPWMLLEIDGIKAQLPRSNSWLVSRESIENRVEKLTQSIIINENSDYTKAIYLRSKFFDEDSNKYSRITLTEFVKEINEINNTLSDTKNLIDDSEVSRFSRLGKANDIGVHFTNINIDELTGELTISWKFIRNYETQNELVSENESSVVLKLLGALDFISRAITLGIEKTRYYIENEPSKLTKLASIHDAIHKNYLLKKDGKNESVATSMPNDKNIFLWNGLTRLLVSNIADKDKEDLRELFEKYELGWVQTMRSRNIEIEFNYDVDENDAFAKPYNVFNFYGENELFYLVVRSIKFIEKKERVINSVKTISPEVIKEVNYGDVGKKLYYENPRQFGSRNTPFLFVIDDDNLRPGGGFTTASGHRFDLENTQFVHWTSTGVTRGQVRLKIANWNAPSLQEIYDSGQESQYSIQVQSWWAFNWPQTNSGTFIGRLVSDLSFNNYSRTFARDEKDVLNNNSNVKRLSIHHQMRASRNPVAGSFDMFLEETRILVPGTTNQYTYEYDIVIEYNFKNNIAVFSTVEDGIYVAVADVSVRRN